MLCLKRLHFLVRLQWSFGKMWTSRRNIWNVSATPLRIKYEWNNEVCTSSFLTQCFCIFWDAQVSNQNRARHRSLAAPRAPNVVQSTDYTLWSLYRSYFMGINANIKQQVYNVTCCWLYTHVAANLPSTWRATALSLSLLNASLFQEHLLCICEHTERKL
jgi:hypothetical protein